MRLIDADKLDWWYKGRPIRRVIDEAPTVDAAPVVRCKDCKKFMEYTEEYAKSVEGADGECYIRVMHSDDEQYQTCKYDDFCSYAERKENNG